MIIGEDWKPDFILRGEWEERERRGGASLYNTRTWVVPIENLVKAMKTFYTMGFGELRPELRSPSSSECLLYEVRVRLPSKFDPHALTPDQYQVLRNSGFCPAV